MGTNELTQNKNKKRNKGDSPLAKKSPKTHIKDIEANKENVPVYCLTRSRSPGMSPEAKFYFDNFETPDKRGGFNNFQSGRKSFFGRYEKSPDKFFAIQLPHSDSEKKRTISR